MKYSASDRTKEVNELADWSEAVTRFLYEGRHSDGMLDLLEMRLSAIRKARERSDLRGLRMVYRDDNEMARGLPLQLRNELDQFLRERFGQGLEKGRRELKKQASAILRRGSIIEAEDYRILETRLASILDDPLKRKEIDAINDLLGTVNAPLYD